MSPHFRYPDDGGDDTNDDDDDDDDEKEEEEKEEDALQAHDSRPQVTATSAGGSSLH